MESEKATNETLVSEEDVEEEVGVDEIGVSKSTSLDQKEILRVLEVVERDSVAIADSFTSLFASLRLALAEVTSTSVDHMQCFSDAAGRLQECDSLLRFHFMAAEILLPVPGFILYLSITCPVVFTEELGDSCKTTVSFCLST
ncbi:uncharacterized protein LOC114281824 isoform X3 [Camellia sinensis]|uniref:uncharacterized protein LOC114281824 isoform X3 n=1 Tax=Camellia sinensis TaxID=4442 RepID=UPI001035F916|nr:uncharacterized protein LOC114281824 isoform X3 [Camellia sinensis]